MLTFLKLTHRYDNNFHGYAIFRATGKGRYFSFRTAWFVWWQRTLARMLGRCTEAFETGRHQYSVSINVIFESSDGTENTQVFIEYLIAILRASKLTLLMYNRKSFSVLCARFTGICDASGQILMKSRWKARMSSIWKMFFIFRNRSQFLHSSIRIAMKWSTIPDSPEWNLMCNTIVWWPALLDILIRCCTRI